jgi:cytochrome c2
MIHRAILAASGLALLAGAAFAAPAGDPAKGMEVFNDNCSICHSVVSTGGGGAGPDLNGVVGRPAASAPGFSYTRALKAKTHSWDAATLDAFLKDPQAFAAGTSMPINITDDKQRADVIAYLATVK